MLKFTTNDIKKLLSSVADVKYVDIKCAKDYVNLIYIESLCDVKFISEYIMTPIIGKIETCKTTKALKEEILVTCPSENVDSLDNAINLLMGGYVLIVAKHLNSVIACEAKGFPKRSINIPITETVIKGPREGFVETLQDNISAIRRRIKTPNLKIEKLVLGNESKTAVAMFYIDGVTPTNLVHYVREKINNVNVKNKKGFVLYSNYIEEELKAKWTPFDTIGYTEKPDAAASKLSEGRVIIMVDGNPFALTAPYFFIENFQTTDDYTMNKFVANFGRLSRFSSIILATLVPGIYLALVSYHFKLIPTIFLVRLSMFRSGVPVPTVIELLYMIFFFQIIREAGVRLPQPIGPTLSIVGALILGDAAVSSGLASQVTVVVVAITSISSYLLPNIYIGLFFWNIIIILFSSLNGLPGFYMGFILFVSHLAGLTSCGYPFLYPFGTLKSFKYKDVITRGSLSRISSSILNGDDEK